MSAFGIEIEKNSVCVLEAGLSKTDVLDRLVAAAAKSGAATDQEDLRKAIHAREAESSTGIGSGVAIPHVRLASVKRPVVAVGVSKAGVEFGSVDGKPVNILVLFAMPADANKLYLGLLAQLMVALKIPNFCDRLIECKTSADVLVMLNETGA